MKEWRTRLLPALSALVDDRGIAGVAVAVGPGVRPEAAWVPGSEGEEPAFLAYSITKVFTAALFLLLQDDGCLALEDPLTRWFPRIPEAERISLRQLLDHRAGIPDYGGLRAYHEAVRTSPSAPWSFDRFMEEIYVQGLLFPPGAGWAYSNLGYMLLKRIVEEVTGKPYAGLIAERIARPLGLHRTFVPESLEELSSLAPAPSRLLSPDGSSWDVRERYHPGWVSHGVVASTPSEIVLFLDGLFAGRLVSRQGLAEMTALAPVPGGPLDRWSVPSYGLGLMGDPASPWGVTWGHNGGGPGYSTSAFHAPDLGGVTVCAMGGIEEGFKAEEVVFAVFDLLAEVKKRQA